MMGQFLFCAFVLGQAFAIFCVCEITEAHSAAVWSSLLNPGGESGGKV